MEKYRPQYRVRVENNYGGKQAIMLEVYDEEYDCFGMMKAYPVENFAKNDKLAQMLLNNLHNIFADKNAKVKIETVNVDE